MKEWIDNGCRLAWLIDPMEQKAYIYRQNAEIESIEDFEQILQTNEVVPNFAIDLSMLK